MSGWPDAELRHQLDMQSSSRDLCSHTSRLLSQLLRHFSPHLFSSQKVLVEAPAPAQGTGAYAAAADRFGLSCLPASALERAGGTLCPADKLRRENQQLGLRLLVHGGGLGHTRGYFLPAVLLSPVFSWGWSS